MGNFILTDRAGSLTSQPLGPLPLQIPVYSILKRHKYISTLLASPGAASHFVTQGTWGQEHLGQLLLHRRKELRKPNLVLPKSFTLLHREPLFHCKSCRDLKIYLFLELDVLSSPIKRKHRISAAKQLSDFNTEATKCEQSPLCSS